MAITISEGWTAVEDVERNLGNLSEIQKIRLANFTNHELYNITADAAPNRLVQSQDYSITSPTNTYALPVDFDDTVATENSLYEQNTDGSLKGSGLPVISVGSTLRGWRIEGDNIIIDSGKFNGDTLTLRYTPLVDDFSDYNYDIFVVPNGKKYLELVRMGLLYQYSIFMRNPAKQQNYGVQYEQLKADYINEITKMPKVENAIDISQVY